MEKIWLKSYPSGVPTDINPDVYHSIVEVFEQSCRQYSQRPSYYNLGKTISFNELDQYSRYFAAYLQQVLKLKKGDRLAIMLPNSLQYPIAMLGAFRAGLIVVNVNPLYTSNELTHQLNDANANAILMLANFTDTLEKSLPDLPMLKHIIVTQLGDLLAPIKGFFVNFALKYIYKKIPRCRLPHVIYFNDAIKEGKTKLLSPIPINSDDTAFLQYTGGTTGVSKGAVLTHRNMIANMEQANAWFSNRLHPGQEIVITALPLYHIFSLMANCLFFTKIGGLNVLITNPRDLPSMIKELRKFKFTAITGVNTLFNALLNNPDFKSLDFSHLSLVLGGGMAVQSAVAEKWEKVTGVHILEAYGLTETSPCVTINPTNLTTFNGSIGLPVPSTDICILNDAHQEVPLGEPGELGVKGPQVMKEYWNNPAETAKVFTKDGWLLTGDMATVDQQGYVRLLERKKDMILVSGFNVYPNEIEDIIAKMPGVLEVAVIAVPDENSGEAPKAFIVTNGKAVTGQEVTDFCRKYLTPYKIPKHIVFIDELPKSNVGKILRRALRSML